MTRKEAIKGSLDKWNAICNDTEDMSKALGRCPLCEIYNDDCHETCPLSEVGKNCGGPPWQDISRILWDENGKAFSKEDPWCYPKIGILDKQKRYTELSVFCNEMRETLQRLYDAEE